MIFLKKLLLLFIVVGKKIVTFVNDSKNKIIWKTQSYF